MKLCLNNWSFLYCLNQEWRKKPREKDLQSVLTLSDCQEGDRNRWHHYVTVHSDISARIAMGSSSKQCVHTDESLIPEAACNDKSNLSVLVTDLLLWGETMTTAAYRGTHVTKTWIQFQRISPWASWLETWRQAIDTALKKQLRTYILTYSQEAEETNWASSGWFEWECPP